MCSVIVVAVAVVAFNIVDRWIRNAYQLRMRKKADKIKILIEIRLNRKRNYGK